MNRRTVYTFVAGLAMLGSLMAPATFYASQLTDAQQKEKQLAEQQKTTQNKITALKAQEQSLGDEITKIEASVQSLDHSINQTQADINRRDEQIHTLELQITQTQKDIDAQYAVLKERIRIMYEEGQASYLDVLFSSTSFSDFLSRMQMLSAIAKGDKEVLQKIQDNKQRLSVAQTQVQQQLAMVKQSYNLLVKQKSEEQSQQRSEQVLLAQVHTTRVSQESALKSENSAMQGLKSLISQLIAQEGQYTGPSDGWTWPVPGYSRISSGYGWRTWSDGTREFHNGIDIPAPIGTPMVAATGGKVLYAGPATGFGDWIVIESAGGLLEIYGHMYAYEIKVYPGEIVGRGQQIASVGSNGESTGPHLHFTVATGFDAAGFAVSVNPTQYVGN